MVTARISKISGTSPTIKARISKISGTGTGGAPKARISRISGKGGVPLSVPAIPDQTVEGLGAATVTVPNLPSFPPGVNFSWRQISGPTVTYADNGNYIAFNAPPILAGGAVVFGVTASLSGQSSSETPATVNVLPHLDHMLTSTGWIPYNRNTL